MTTEQSIVVDTTIHEIEAVKRLCYSLGNRCVTELQRIDDAHLRVTCRALGGAQLPDDFLDAFNNGLIDFGIRVSLMRDTATVRDLIYRQAFAEADL